MANENGPPTLMVFLMQKINLRKENIMADLQMQTVYISGETAGQRFDCQPIEIPFKLTESVWPYVVEAPDGSFKNPTYDWHDRKWIDQDAASQGQQITALDQKVDAITSKVQDLQTANTNTTKTNQASNKKLDDLTELITTVNANVGQMSVVLGKLVQSMSTDQATQPTKPTQATQATQAKGSVK